MLQGRSPRFVERQEPDFGACRSDVHARTFDFRSPTPASGSVTLTCDFVTLAARGVFLHALDFLGRHPSHLVDGEGPDQPLSNSLAHLVGCHVKGAGGFGHGVGSRHGAASLNATLQFSRRPLGREPVSAVVSRADAGDWAEALD